MKKIRSNHISLKWGTLKSWNFKDDPKAVPLIEEYNTIGSSMSAMTQHDTPEQKEIICKLIDLVYGKIFLDWEGKWVTKKEAKNYVKTYGNN